MKTRLNPYLFILVLLSLPIFAIAKPHSYPINRIDEKGVGEQIGTITIDDSKAGLVVDVDANGFSPNSQHGFHLHENPSCAPTEKEGKAVAGLAAGGHFDPAKTNKHEGPNGNGHLGDLPEIRANDQGVIKQRVVYKKLTTAEVQHRAFVIHAEADNYADKLGGARIACTVVQ
jgi:Cu-Zn family superoxide dismutase